MLTLGGEPFTTGRAEFFDRSSDSPEPTAKIYVKVQFSGHPSTYLAQVDTGSAYSMLGSEVAADLGVLDGEGEKARISTRVGRIDGKLERLRMVMIADEGKSLEFEATFFVSQDWTAQTFLGYSGLLDRLRIGLDPASNNFFFGSALGDG